jgi:hypothetical protein
MGEGGEVEMGGPWPLVWNDWGPGGEQWLLRLQCTAYKEQKFRKKKNNAALFLKLSHQLILRRTPMRINMTSMLFCFHSPFKYSITLKGNN